MSTRGQSGRWLFAGVLLVAGLRAGSAHAFSDPMTFSQPTISHMPEATQGGGGGRYFTGSPADGYTCKVCHSGGAPAPLRILGLPLSGYTPGVSYEITIDWPDSLQHVAMAIEITDEGGIGAGTVRVPPMGELQASERCAGTPISAGQVNPILNRTVIQMPDCGAQQLRFLWTAPTSDRGDVRLAGSLVSTNASQNIDGDGVTDIMRVIGSPRTPTAGASQIGGCSLQPSAASSRTPLAAFAALLVACTLLARRRKIRR